MIRWECPKCGERLEAPEAMVGSAFSCPACGNVSLAAIIAAPPPAAINYGASAARKQKATAIRVLTWAVILLAVGLLCWLLNNAMVQTGGEPSGALGLISGLSLLCAVVFGFGGIIRLLVAAGRG